MLGLSVYLVPWSSENRGSTVPLFCQMALIPFVTLSVNELTQLSNH